MSSDGVYAVATGPEGFSLGRSADPGAAVHDIPLARRTDTATTLRVDEPSFKSPKPLSDIFVSKFHGFWDQFRGKNRGVSGWTASAKNALLSSRLNILLLCIPIAWLSHFENVAGHWPHRLTFASCFLSITTLNRLIDWSGKEMALYFGKGLGDFLVAASSNAVDAILAVVLLCKCELRLLQSLIIGVIALHLILIPGTAFLAGGALVWEQQLHEHHTQLNRSLLAIGVLAIFLPTTFFAALYRGPRSLVTNDVLQPSGHIATDHMHTDILTMSRGLVILLLIVYVCCRFYLDRAPPEEYSNDQALAKRHKREYGLPSNDAEMNPWACMIILVISLGLTATTAVFLVESIDAVRSDGHIQEEWFGLILLPLASFSADGVVLLLYFAQAMFHRIAGKERLQASDFAQARSIDVSIQFVLFWMPFIVLLGWWVDKPMHLLFDYYELAIVAGSCLLLNYVTADMKTNWIEGFILIGFYTMIAISSWYYVGQPELELMLNCPGSNAATVI